MDSQEIIVVDGKRLNYKNDYWLQSNDKMVPLDRIQDVNIEQDCVERLCGISNVTIQTAAGGKKPEITLIAPRDPQAVRDSIIMIRDNYVQKYIPPEEDGGLGGTGLSLSSVRSAGIGDGSEDSLLSPEDLAAVNSTLARVQSIVEKGLLKLES